MALPYVVVLTVSVYLYHLSNSFEYERMPRRIGPDIWPKIILLLMAVTALWGLAAIFFSAGSAASAPASEIAEDEALIHPPEIHPWLVWICVAATLIYIYLLSVVGFFIATVVYLCVLMYLGHYRKPLRVAGLSVAIAFVFMFLFMRVVYVSLPLGVAPFEAVSNAMMALMGVH
jgi:putative tricarboxylic transport membrane protein